MSYVELTPAQVKTIEALGTVTVRAALIKPAIVAIVRTFAAQEVRITIAADGGIDEVEVQYDSL